MYFLPFLTLKNCQRFFASGGKAVGTVNTPSSFSPVSCCPAAAWPREAGPRSRRHDLQSQRANLWPLSVEDFYE